MVSQVLANAILNQKAPDILGSFREGQEFAKGQQVKQLAGEALQAGGGERLQELIGLDPEVGYALADAIGARNAKELNSFVRDARIVDNLFKSGSVGQAKQFIEQSLATAVNLGQKGDSQRNLLNILNNKGLKAAGDQVNAFLATLEKSNQVTSSIQNRESDAQALVGSIDPSTGIPFTSQTANATLVRLGAGIDATQGTLSTQERLGRSPGDTQDVAQSQASIAAAKAGSSEEAKQKIKSLYAPRLAADILNAKTKAESEGKVFSDLNRAQAGLPAIVDLVTNLKALSNVASSTLGKRGFDAVVRELGFGSTKGGTARAKYIAVVANTLLPLLKTTFGGAFSVEEGNRLLATLGSPNLDANARNAELDAFLESKISQIEGLRAQASTIETKDNTSPPGKFEGFSILSKSK